ncbi:hypothetical protein AB0F92_30505 [Kitasatospora aureofaciens]|uniref:Uncharacterized protein n=1 Tax=Kitasatospora aureofaciens TaxID=1894 RepID=A0A1E7MVS3_KITAU|nr:hypothetical protein [Kitasatospora aureofaciens]OEV32363.1 hypothetical protein HS99_0016830 [Kitasatospora aureofaciens]UKZ10545.1 hypothetical protein BOQ63_042345 [Streptomyces viridifaciens]
MAGLLIDGDDLVVRLAWWERIVARRREVRVPLDTVTEVDVQPDRWRALRGVRIGGLAVPGALCLGVWRHKDGRDFVALRGHRAVLCVGLRPPAPFAGLAVETDDPLRTAAELRTVRGRAGPA